MPAYIYHILHLIGILMLFMGYGALLGRSMASSDHAGVKKLGSITSGIGLVLIIIAGFGLMAKVYSNSFLPWMMVKLAIWVILGGLIALINRKPALATTLWWTILGLGSLSIILVYTKPF